MNPLPLRDLGDGVVGVDVSGSLDVSRIPAFVATGEALRAWAGLRAVVLLGGPDHFNTGAHRAALLDAGTPITDYVAALPRELLSWPVPTVAAMAGHAVGGGLVLGLWCDAVVLASDRLYGANFMALGFTPGMGATVVLDDAMGPYLAREMLMGGRLYSGAELRERAAPLPHVLPSPQVEASAIELARTFAAPPPLATRALRATLAGRRRERLERALTEEARMHQLCFADPATRAAIADAMEGP